MLNKAHLILYANIALFIYTLMQVSQRLLAAPNAFTTFFQNTSRTVTHFINQTLAPVAQWQNVIQVLLVFVIILLIIRFFHVGILLLEICAGLVLVDWLYQYFTHQQNLTLLYPLAVLFISLFSIRFIAKEMALI
ncbi:hypothetical protein [Lactococcus garvieae]|jgi:hypothetical protein|uniref:hypothetical protein n=1 Tax=Lactococcus garvieae TaxID=1363 RepID=UPI0018D8F49C|nr:hypothetical protein [Lactococcus garvieae]QPS71221.1 hypothetical protein I6G50_00745 [Lactococcus garvieae]